MTVWIDSDSCPAAVRTIVAEKVRGIHEEGKGPDAVFIANRPVPLPDDNCIKFHLASKEKDSADNFIIENAVPGDIVLTRDFLLADKTVRAGIATMNFDGRLFDQKWLERRIEERNIMEVLYNSGSVDRYRKKKSFRFKK